MKTFAAGIAVLGSVLLSQLTDNGSDRYGPERETALASSAGFAEAYDHPPRVQVSSESQATSLTTTSDLDLGFPPEIAPEALTEVVQRYCVVCHNDQLRTGNLSLQEFDVAAAPQRWETAEKMITKLRAGMMPPAGIPRPGGDTLLALVETLETLVDEAAARNPNPGTRSFQRLNRAEYRASIRDLLTLDVDPASWLPVDLQSDGFDNVTAAQPLSATLLDGYLRAASAISRMAIGDPNISSRQIVYSVPRSVSQSERVDGAPIGTRGGISVIHNFPADGQYTFTMAYVVDDVGDLHGRATPFDEQIEVSINGERVALLDVDRFMTESDPGGATQETEPIFVEAGPQRVTAAFIDRWEGPVNDNIAPAGHSLVDIWIGKERGITNVTHLGDLTITGPADPIGLSETPSRAKIFSCRPASPSEEMACAEEIIRRLAREAYRRPLVEDDVEDLLSFYQRGAALAGFEEGVRMALEAILASPYFVFRLEDAPADLAPDQTYRISDLELASRLSFFLWGQPPQDELLSLAIEGRLSDPEVLDRQVSRMLDDPRAEALASRFAAQWLQLAGMEAVQPNYVQYPDYDSQLGEAMRRETELLFYHLVREDRSVRELFDADYTFVNERLAEHYGIPGVVGDHFRRVNYPDDRRGGILGHASILMLTSHAGRTSPVDRGKWVMEVLLGTPPPPPPPNVPALEATAGVQGGRMLTTRERMEIHRANPVCASCHNMIDPIGLALENFNVTGQWRIRDNGMPIDPSSKLWDGTPIAGPADLREALLDRPESLFRTFTKNLMTYALGRRIEYYDMPTVRAITREAKANDYRVSSFIRGVVHSPAFQMKRAETVAQVEDNASQ